LAVCIREKGDHRSRGATIERAAASGVYGIRSERQLIEQLNYNLLFRWFVGLSPDDPVWDPTVFTKNRERLQQGDVFQKFMAKLLDHPRSATSVDEHFSVDGTLIEAWASQQELQAESIRRR